MFFGMDWLAALIKISFQVVFAIVTAIPFYFMWNCIAGVYFTFLPVVWLNIPYWHVVSLLFIVSIIGELIQKLTPKFLSVSQTVNKED